jgi:putative hydrolase of HD superfamily
MVKGSSIDPFFRSVLQLKSVKRAGWVSKVKVRHAESVADHTFSMCAMAMLLSDMMALDTRRAMKMVILHDLAESIVGDFVPGDLAAAEKTARERKALAAILKGLPQELRSEYGDIWDEYAENRSDIARFVHRLDKLEMGFQASQYARQGYKKSLLSPFLKSARAAAGDEGDIISHLAKKLKP